MSNLIVEQALYEGVFETLIGFGPDGRVEEDPAKRMQASVERFDLLSRTRGEWLATVVFAKAMIDVEKAADEARELLEGLRDDLDE